LDSHLHGFEVGRVEPLESDMARDEALLTNESASAPDDAEKVG